jgi:hypothetical protein
MPDEELIEEEAEDESEAEQEKPPPNKGYAVGTMERTPE